MKALNVTIAGGGSTYTPGILVGFIKKKLSFPVKKLVLYDNNLERVMKMGKFAQILLRDYYPEVEVIYTNQPKEAFTGVDYVFCQIRTGGLKMREGDEKIPIKHGVIGQETCGPGGFSYGMRSINDMIKLVKEIRKYAKDAWILNYTNPAAIVAVALQRAFPNDQRILNICDQPISLLMAYARLLGNINYKDMKPHYFGLNHFGWFTKIIDKRNNEDITQKIKDTIQLKGFKPADAEKRDPSWLVTYSTVKDMLDLDDTYLPNTYLQYYLFRDRSFSHLDPNYTRANEVMNGREKRVYEECNRVIKNNSAHDTPALKDLDKQDAHGDMIIEIAEAIYQNNNRHYVVIVANKDKIIENLDEDVMVEVLCKLGKNGPKPYRVGKIGTYHKGLIEQQAAYEKLTVDAYFEKSYKKALQALTLNRTITDMELAKKILDELIIHNEGYWPILRR
ncbi:MAG TPA: maltose-6'-phosphate glucosidase [Acholeplasmataceae bacterium]|nr:maltose-6'-phosphate glucosidase [Acholeplasmataceae bacterium]HQC30378.1 maltose-6'-phosphate glucosidase [Acholeplasmataceae bacterium]